REHAPVVRPDVETVAVHRDVRGETVEERLGIVERQALDRRVIDARFPTQVALLSIECVEIAVIGLEVDGALEPRPPRAHGAPGRDPSWASRAVTSPSGVRKSRRPWASAGPAQIGERASNVHDGLGAGTSSGSRAGTSKRSTRLRRNGIL